MLYYKVLFLLAFFNDFIIIFFILTARGDSLEFVVFKRKESRPFLRSILLILDVVDLNFIEHLSMSLIKEQLCMLGRNFLFVLRLECETLFPVSIDLLLFI